MLEKGDKAIKTGFMKWSKDWVSASLYYTKAAEGFQLIKNYD